jgi:hypothetical protein
LLCNKVVRDPDYDSKCTDSASEPNSGTTTVEKSQFGAVPLQEELTDHSTLGNSPEISTIPVPSLSSNGEASLPPAVPNYECEVSLPPTPEDLGVMLVDTNLPKMSSNLNDNQISSLNLNDTHSPDDLEF